MCSPSVWSTAVWLSVSAAIPAWAQFDGIGGPVEFRSADRPIGVPTLRVPEWTGLSSDPGKLFSGGPPRPDDVLKRIDVELGQPGPPATSGSDAGRPSSRDDAGEHLEKRPPASSAYK